MVLECVLTSFALNFVASYLLSDEVVLGVCWPVSLARMASDRGTYLNPFSPLSLHLLSAP